MTRSEEKRAQIIDAAARLFVESGFGAVSMDTIASEANVSKRTVYSHFSDKSSLFVAVMDRHCEVIGGRPVLQDGGPDRVLISEDIAVDLPDQSPEAVLTAFCTRFLMMLLTPQATSLFRVIVGEAERFPELATSFDENGPKPLIRRLSTYFESQNAVGTLRIEDPLRAAWQLLGMIKEPWHFRMSLALSPPPSREEIDIHVKETLKFFLRGYAVKD